MAPAPFRFKKFSIDQDSATYPISTDSILLGAWATIADAATVLDIGTGTGVLALMIAQRSESRTQITGIDLLAAACRCAARNFAASPWAGRLQAVESPVQVFATDTMQCFDLIVSNPPYFSSTVVSPNTNRRLSRNTGALPPHELLTAVDRLLALHGRFCVILPVQEGRRLIECGAIIGLYCTAETAVYTRTGKPAERLLLQFERNPYPFRRSRLVIYDRGEERSAEFRHLTQDFYL